MVAAAEGGRFDEIAELLNEGADIECKGRVRHVYGLENTLLAAISVRCVGGYCRDTRRVYFIFNHVAKYILVHYFLFPKTPCDEIVRLCAFWVRY